MSRCRTTPHPAVSSPPITRCGKPTSAAAVRVLPQVFPSRGRLDWSCSRLAPGGLAAAHLNDNNLVRVTRGWVQGNIKGLPERSCFHSYKSELTMRWRSLSRSYPLALVLALLVPTCARPQLSVEHHRQPHGDFRVARVARSAVALPAESVARRLTCGGRSSIQAKPLSCG